MDKKLVTKALSLSLMCLSINAIAEEVVYRWVDKNNVVHFSQRQPEHDNYTTLTLAGNKRPTQQAKSSNFNIDNAQTQADKSENEKSDLDNTVEQRCQEAQNNLKTLTEFENVQVTNEKGELKLLTQTEKNNQIKLTKKQIEVYCK